MIIFHKFEHSTLPISITKQILIIKGNKNNWVATTCATLIILFSSNISHSLTYPKAWVKRPKRLKIL